MAQVLSPNQQNAHMVAVSKPITIPTDVRQPPPGKATLPAPLSVPGMRSGHLNLDTFSPVNQNGSFAFDQVLKSGEVNKRTRKTKVRIPAFYAATRCSIPLTAYALQQWKPFYLVLRPNLLSIYKDTSESRLHKQISLSDLTAVTYLKDPKGRRENVFGLYSPARNFHLQAGSQAEAQEWVELIKREARIDEQQEQEMLLNSPITAAHEGLAGHDQWQEHAATSIMADRLASSSPEPVTTRDGIRIPGIRPPSAPSLDYSGDELNGPYMSDFSETQTPPSSYQQPFSSFGSFIPRKQRQQNLPLHQHHQTPYSHPHYTTNERQLSTATRSLSQVSIGASHAEHDVSSFEKVIWHGYLLLLRTNRAGVRQWKKLWVVLRPKNLAFYKSDEEYAAVLILPLSTCVDAVEIDPVSKSKRHCMQIITEEKGYRFCAESEDKLAEWLGALKMVMSWRREKEKEKEK